MRSLDLRYEGQSYEINVSAGRAADFDDIHAKRFGYSHAGRPVQTVTARVRAIGRTPEADQPDLTATSDQPRFASVYVPNGWRCRETLGSNTILERT